MQAKYALIEDRATLPAIGIEIIGAFGSSTLKLFDEIARLGWRRTGYINARSRLYRTEAADV